ncbi:GH25 family lysozyme [Paenibacillus polymyxa]|nr:GH25 family lysozyme [Paenibacillus polymyxa]MDU8671568.1 GH25 family lysozyme [Paenibacillus polymyxa]MDU8696478.1 GH25 family lysozyme [Paenibacillus polymyxa]URJ57640.1 GH25 family lysozyme [Paenibacillus polymyxa]URJ67612.1 GH25 family lysozyme [Paenibacillus polymyxa]URJ72153.1 GH25 family lysozyme [Paenibacillus polymyxa]
MEEVERMTGVKPIIYTYPSFIGNFSGLSNYPLWIARYHATKAPADASGWSRWDFWQYSDGENGGMLPSSKRKVAGIAGPVDLNEYNGTVDEMRARFGKGTAAPKKEFVKDAVFQVGGKTLGKALLFGSKTHVPLRALATALGVSCN